MIKATLGNRMFMAMRRLVSSQPMAPRVPVSLPMQFSIVRCGTGVNTTRSRNVDAMTTDLSLSGLAFETRTIQVDNLHILQSADMTSPQYLEIVLELPERALRMEGIAQRYERRQVGTGNYVIGVRITGMKKQDREYYEEWLQLARNGPAVFRHADSGWLARREA